MTKIGQRERETQNRVVKLFTKDLGYDYLGDWQDRSGNSNVEVEYLTNWLSAGGHTDTLIKRVLRQLDLASALGGGRNLYDANKGIYSLLRYGVKVKDGGWRSISNCPSDRLEKSTKQLFWYCRRSVYSGRKQKTSRCSLVCKWYRAWRDRTKTLKRVGR